MLNTLKNNKGMTLIEIIIVLAIIGGLMATLLPKVMGNKEKANRSQAKIGIQSIIESLETYSLDCGSYPQGLDGLITQPSDCDNWGPSPYMKKLPKDPWNNEYEYTLDGGSYIIKSYAKDGREGGEGNDKDISSEDL